MAITRIITPAVNDDAVTLAKMASGTDGNIISYDASGNPVAIATGSDGQVLTSAGAGAQPAFETLPGGGKILQVVSAQESQVRSTTTGSFQNISGVSLQIAPSATNSKIWISVVLVLSCANHGVVRFIREVSGQTTVVVGAGVTASGSRQNASMTSNSNDNAARPQPFQFLDSPSTTATITYRAQWIANSGSTSVYLNRTPNDTDATYGSRFASTLTLMEVGA